MKLKDRLRQNNIKEAAELAQNAAAVDAANGRMFLLVLMIGVATFGTLWVLTYLVQGFEIFRMPDIVLAFAFLALFGLSRLPQLHVPAVAWLYCTFVIYTAVTIASGLLVTTDYVDVMIFVCLFQLPVLTLDHSWRVDLIVVILALAYILIVVPNKAAELAKNEIVNVFFFTASALAAGGFLRRTRIENFELERQSRLRETTDYLTGLFNRRKLFDYFSEKEKKGCEEPITGMLMLDIDNFKLFNDSYGHLAGDECLRRIAECMRELSEGRPVRLFRYGGEEFLGTSCTLARDELCGFCEQLAEKVRSMNIPHEAVEKGRVTVSIGYMTTEADAPCGSYEQMITEADAALYEAKRTGRDRVVGYEPRMADTVQKSFH